MLGKEFRSLAEAVTCTYGSNPWFFLRELAQNSRDAGATRIMVKAETTAAGFELLTFADNGRGLSQPHARRFLFRLYASDKTNDTMSAGKYGIGFWTILGFQPDQITIQSRHKDDSWAITLNANLEAQPASCTLASPGTIICLRRKAVFSNASEFIQRVEKELRAQCQYLRRNDHRGTMLPVFFHGQNITKPITLPGPLSYAFHSRTVEGAVGLGEKPLVQLYARGLPVWEGAVLSQMSHLQFQPQVQSEIGRGLAPVFLLNGNSLDVTFARNLVQENRAMGKVRDMAEKALQHLLANAMESAFPRKWTQRGSDYMHVLFSRLRRPGWKLLPLLLLIILPLEILLLDRCFTMRAAPGLTTFDLNSASIEYAGATVSGAQSELSTRFGYSPPHPFWFRIFAAIDYDLHAGFVRAGETFSSSPPSFSLCGPEKIVHMQFPASKAGKTLLPVPPGHAIDPANIHFLPKDRRLALAVNDRGENSVELPGIPGQVFYRSCPQARDPELTSEERARLTALPATVEWPEALVRSLTAARFSNAENKAARARDLVRAFLRFDTSASTMRAYRRNQGSPQWLTRVLAIGKGDCDIINGVHVLFMRKMGVPARLAIGLVGSHGRIEPGLHAWSEYYDNGWRIADASDGPAGIALPATVPENESSPANKPIVMPSGRSWPGLVTSPALAAPALAFMLLTAAWIYRKKYKSSRVRHIAGAASATKDMLLPVIQHALLRPEFWGQQSPLWNHRFLPTLNNRPMAIRRALALQRRKRLLLTTERSPLAVAMSRGRSRVLDLSQECFAPLRPLFSGAIHLDPLWHLQPQPSARAGKKTDDLLAAVNILLDKINARPALCLLAPGLRSSDFQTVSLPPLPRAQGTFFPRCFIAVNPTARPLIDAAELIASNRPLAIFKFLQALNSESLLPATAAQACLRKAARRLLVDHP